MCVGHSCFLDDIRSSAREIDVVWVNVMLQGFAVTCIFSQQNSSVGDGLESDYLSSVVARGSFRGVPFDGAGCVGNVLCLQGKGGSKRISASDGVA